MHFETIKSNRLAKSCSISKGLCFYFNEDQILPLLKLPKQFSEVEPLRSLLLTSFPATSKGATGGRVPENQMPSLDSSLINQKILTLILKHTKAPLK